MMMTNEAANEPAMMTALAIAIELPTCSQSKMDSVQCELCNMNNHNNNTTCMFNLIICMNFKYFITY